MDVLGAGDTTDEMARKDGKNLALSIWHIPSGRGVRFKALITAFSDTFDSSWSSEEVYGRMDPIETFQGTRRVITLSWDVVSFGIEEAKSNLKKMDMLANFLYPVYGPQGGATSIEAAPLLRIKFSNLIRQPGTAGEGTSEDNGLVARMAGFSYTPDFDSGVFMDGKANTKLYPQTIRVDATFNIFHTHQLGWGRDQKPRKGGFPHGATMLEGRAQGIRAPAPTPTIAAAENFELLAPPQSAGVTHPDYPQSISVADLENESGDEKIQGSGWGDIPVFKRPGPTRE